MHHRHRLTTAVAALVAGSVVAAGAGPAEAAHPLKHTVYRGDGGQPGTDVTVKFTLKVGGSPDRINRATVEVSCPTAPTSWRAPLTNDPVGPR